MIQLGLFVMDVYGMLPEDFDKEIINLATEKEDINAQQPYYIASVSKMVTSVLFGQ